MKKSILLMVVACAVLLFSQCATSKKSTAKMPGQQELAIAQKRWPAATMATLTEGHQVFTTKCNKCHGLKDIPSRSEENWIKAIGMMAPKAKLTEDEKEKLTQYILSTREAAANAAPAK